MLAVSPGGFARWGFFMGAHLLLRAGAVNSGRAGTKIIKCQVDSATKTNKALFEALLNNGPIFDMYISAFRASRISLMPFCPAAMTLAAKKLVESDVIRAYAV